MCACLPVRFDPWQCRVHVIECNYCYILTSVLVLLISTLCVFLFVGIHKFRFFYLAMIAILTLPSLYTVHVMCIYFVSTLLGVFK